jgi:hypothetical protein
LKELFTITNFKTQTIQCSEQDSRKI